MAHLRQLQSLFTAGLTRRSYYSFDFCTYRSALPADIRWTESCSGAIARVARSFAELRARRSRLRPPTTSPRPDRKSSGASDPPRCQDRPLLAQAANAPPAPGPLIDHCNHGELATAIRLTGVSLPPAGWPESSASREHRTHRLLPSPMGVTKHVCARKALSARPLTLHAEFVSWPRPVPPLTTNLNRDH